ncbi:uncharacterized protein NEMAJ01_1289 [Nematocida major]|uniref:uncharacterized protein n=1 Tax=Nematocida major TaxID=1912982 RepID=UPI0020081BEF|nr:uncharacterized protein NEMAJ01_1289 [Nematocida major]KAH9386393.1 hypothetical protein NEMAJ01_1289 [Nematocida major]
MKVLGILMIVVAAMVRCYQDAEPVESKILATVPFRTLFFLRKLTPYSSKVDAPLPMGAHRRLESEERFSPFHSVLVIRRQKSPALSIRSELPGAESAESFIKDFLVSHLQHVNAMEKASQFNTERIYNEMYKKEKKANANIDRYAHHSGMLDDEIDSIMAHAAKEISVPAEEIENNTSLGKNLKKTKRRVGKNLKKAKKEFSKKVKLNSLTILLFVVIGLISAFAGYSLRGRGSTENYVPLDK